MSGARGAVVVRFRENCFVRAAPSAAGAVLGVAKRGDALPFGGEARGGWLAVEYLGSPGWVTGRFGQCARGILDKVPGDG